MARVTPAVRGGFKRVTRDSAQSHLVFATDTVPFADKRKYAIMVLANILGGGMSSRLFQRVREELGLAYAVYAFSSFFRGIGTTGVYVGTQPQTAQAAADAIRGELATLSREGLRGDALKEAKLQTQGQVMLSLESPTAKMYRLAGGHVYGEAYRSLDDVLKEIVALTEDDVSAAAAEFFTPERYTLVWLGPNS
jgi:predicted Zn-dependent peptidase